MESTLLQHTIFQPHKIKSEKHCLEIISNNEFKKLLFNILNLTLKNKFNNEDLHMFSFMFFVNHYESFIKVNYGQFEIFLINKSKSLYKSFKKILGLANQDGQNDLNYNIALQEFEIFYESYIDYYKLWKYESNYYLFIKYYEIYEVICYNIKILSSITPSVINNYLLKHCIKIKNSFLKKFETSLPDFKQYYNEFYTQKKKIKDYSYIFLATTKFYKELIDELIKYDYSTIKILNKELIQRLKDLYPDNNIEFNLNDICICLHSKDYEKVIKWINDFYNVVSEYVDVKFKTNYNIWKLKSVQYFNSSNLNNLVCSFYQFLHDELNLIEENKKLFIASNNIRYRSIIPRIFTNEEFAI